MQKFKLKDLELTLTKGRDLEVHLTPWRVDQIILLRDRRFQIIDNIQDFWKKPYLRSGTNEYDMVLIRFITTFLIDKLGLTTDQIKYLLPKHGFSHMYISSPRYAYSIPTKLILGLYGAPNGEGHGSLKLPLKFPKHNGSNRKYLDKGIWKSHINKHFNTRGSKRTRISPSSHSPGKIKEGKSRKRR